MAIIRTLDNNENGLNFVGTLLFVCTISCAIIMFWFRGFKATFNIAKNQSNLAHYDNSPGVSHTGVYRSNKDELFGSTTYPNPPKKITPSMVSLPAVQTEHRKDISKSTNNLAQPLNETINKTKSTPNIPEVVPEPLTRNQIKEQKILEKKDLDEQKKQAKLAAKEQEKAEKLKKEREKEMQKKKAEEMIKSKKRAPQPQPQPQQQAMPVMQAKPVIATRSEGPSTNTLESISRSSGPPPYSKEDTIVNNKSDPSGNTSFADDSTWNMISEHRLQVNRPVVVKSIPKQTRLDLHYNKDQTRDKSDA